jgi:hypothetical protein
VLRLGPQASGSTRWDSRSSRSRRSRASPGCTLSTLREYSEYPERASRVPCVSTQSTQREHPEYPAHQSSCGLAHVCARTDSVQRHGSTRSTPSTFAGCGVSTHSTLKYPRRYIHRRQDHSSPLWLRRCGDLYDRCERARSRVCVRACVCVSVCVCVCV